LTKLRSSDSNEDDAKMAKIEYEDVNIFRLDQSNKINSYK